MKSRIKLESHLIRKTSLKRVGVFMLFSILVCCVSSILSFFNNDFENCQSGKSQAFISNKCTGAIGKIGFENLLADGSYNSQLGSAGRIFKRFTDNELNRSLLSFDLSKIDKAFYSLCSFELKLQEKFNRNSIKGNIGISERFQV